MKTKTLSLALAVLAAIPGTALAQNVFPTNGNVGIGTTNPAAQLHVSAPSGNTALSNEIGTLQLGNANGTANNFEGILFTESHGNPIAGIFGMNVAHGLASISAAGNLIFTTKQYGTPHPGYPEERMRVTSDGNVGIGTSTPQSKLHVAGAITADNLNVGSPSTGARGVVHIDGSATDAPVVALSDIRSQGRTWNFYSGENTRGFFSISDVTGNQTRLVIDTAGNVGIGTQTPQSKLDVNGKINCTVLELTSDRNQKQDFAAVDSRRVLDRLVGLPIQIWAYTNDAQVRRIGPMAQDWKAAYPELGSDDKHIAAGDLGSVALAAIQGLNAKLTESLKEKDAEIDTLKKELQAMKMDYASFSTRFDKLEKVLTQAGPASQPATASVRVLAEPSTSDAR